MSAQSHPHGTVRPARRRGAASAQVRTAAIVVASAAVLVGLVVGTAVLVSRIVELAGWIAGS